MDIITALPMVQPTGSIRVGALELRPFARKGRGLHHGTAETQGLSSFCVPTARGEVVGPCPWPPSSKAGALCETRRRRRCSATATNRQQGDARMAHVTGAWKTKLAVMRALALGRVGEVGACHPSGLAMPRRFA